MTREEAISTSKLNEAQRTLYYIAENMKMNKSISEEGYGHFQMAIAALKFETCEDVVSREAVLNTLDTMDKALDEDRTVEAYKELLKECYKELPPVTPKQRTGKWIVHERDGIEDLECHQCGVWFLHEHLVRNSFCPNCGAKMEGEDE